MGVGHHRVCGDDDTALPGELNTFKLGNSEMSVKVGITETHLLLLICCEDSDLSVCDVRPLYKLLSPLHHRHAKMETESVVIISAVN